MKHNEICVRVQGRDQRLGSIDPTGVGAIMGGAASLIQAGTAIFTAVQENKRANEKLQMQKEEHGKQMVLMDQAIEKGKEDFEQLKKDYKFINEERARQVKAYYDAIAEAKAQKEKSATAGAWQAWAPKAAKHDLNLNDIASGFGSFAMLIQKLGGLDVFLDDTIRKQIDFVVALGGHIIDKAKEKALPSPLIAVLSSLISTDFQNETLKKSLLWQLEYVKDGTYSLSNMLDNIHGNGDKEKYARALQYGLFQISGGDWLDLGYSEPSNEIVQAVKIEYQDTAEEVSYDTVRRARKVFNKNAEPWAFGLKEISKESVDKLYRAYTEKVTEYNNKNAEYNTLKNKVDALNDAAAEWRKQFWYFVAAGFNVSDKFNRKHHGSPEELSNHWRQKNKDAALPVYHRMLSNYPQWKKDLLNSAGFNIASDKHTKAAELAGNLIPQRNNAEREKNQAKSAMDTAYKKYNDAVANRNKVNPAIKKNKDLLANYAKLHKARFGFCMFFPEYINAKQFEEDLNDPLLMMPTPVELESGYRDKRLYLSLERICKGIYKKILDKILSYKDYSSGLNNAPSLFRGEADVKNILRTLLLSNTKTPQTAELVIQFLNSLDDAVRKSKCDFAFSQSQIPTVVKTLIQNQQPHIAGLMLQFLCETALANKPYAIYANVDATNAIKGGVQGMIVEAWNKIKGSFQSGWKEWLPEVVDQDTSQRWVELYYHTLEDLQIANPLGLFNVNGVDYVEEFAKFLDTQQTKIFTSFEEMEDKLGGIEPEKTRKIRIGVRANGMHLIAPQLKKFGLRTSVTLPDYAKLAHALKWEDAGFVKLPETELPKLSPPIPTPLPTPVQVPQPQFAPQAAPVIVKKAGFELNKNTAIGIGAGIVLLALLTRRNDRRAS